MVHNIATVTPLTVYFSYAVENFGSHQQTSRIDCELIPPPMQLSRVAYQNDYKPHSL